MAHTLTWNCLRHLQSRWPPSSPACALGWAPGLGPVTPISPRCSVLLLLLVLQASVGPQLMPFPHPLDPALPASWPLEGARSRNSRVTGVWERLGRGWFRSRGSEEGDRRRGAGGLGTRGRAGEQQPVRCIVSPCVTPPHTRHQIFPTHSIPLKLQHQDIWVSYSNWRSERCTDSPEGIVSLSVLVVQ